MSSEDTVIAVIRGELPLLSLNHVGIHAIVKEHSYEEQVNAPLEVTPSLDDVAHGLWTYRDQADELRR